jgi:hypothetical protein
MKTAFRLTITLGLAAFLSTLRSVSIPNSVTSIGLGAFKECNSLTDVEIPSGVIYIGSRAFWQCQSLTSVTIPNRITSIEAETFGSCTNLTRIQFLGDAPSVAGVVFQGAQEGTIYRLPGTTGWGPTFGGRRTALWLRPSPTILTTAFTLGIQTNSYGFTVSWATNALVLVEASPNLTNPVWSALTANALTAGTFLFSDPEWRKHPSQFYRVHSP